MKFQYEKNEIIIFDRNTDSEFIQIWHSITGETGIWIDEDYKLVPIEDNKGQYKITKNTSNKS